MSKPFHVICPNCSHEFTFKRVSKHLRSEIEERFWSKVYCDPNTGCFFWFGALDGSGRYGEFRIASDDPNEDSKVVRAHRFAYELTKGKIPEGLSVLHKCDNPRCVNPDHLRIGTHRENMEDMARKGRAGQRKMTFETVLEIKRLRSAGKSCRKICEETGRAKSTVQAILEGRTWKHVRLGDSDGR